MAGKWARGVSWRLLVRNPSYVSLVFGIALGFTVTTQMRNVFSFDDPLACPAADSRKEARAAAESGLVFVGVMTTFKFVDTRAVAIFDTWGRTVPGKVVFFSSENTTSARLPVVALAGVDDSYPPQKKSFAMLKYMHDHFLERFEWFVRADDDVYVRTDKLERFLRSVNSSKPLFIGQAGVGNKEEFGLLNLEPDENFCMGGPGVILSRETLRRLAPHVDYCVRNLYSNHEDVEVGRCVRKFVGIPCTWSYEMQSIFYHNFSGEITVESHLKSPEVHRAITLHAIKRPPAMYRVHGYMLGLEMHALRHRALLLHRAILQTSRTLKIPAPSVFLNGTFLGNASLLGTPPAVDKFRPADVDEVLPWSFLGRNVHSASSVNPRRKMESHWGSALTNAINEIMDMINRYSKQRGRFITFKELYYGYVRVDPLHSVEYVLDLLMTYNKYRGKKMSVPVRRHAYVQQAFHAPHVRQVPVASDAVIHFILPLAGRLHTFRRFLANFENVALARDGRATLTVVLFDGDDFDAIVEHVDEVASRHPNGTVRLKVLPGNFSRAVALDAGAKMHPPHALLFFVDVDIAFDAGSLFRVRANAMRGRQVYFPIVFSRYDPATYPDTLESRNPFWIHEDVGYWRQFGYGIVGIYGSDLRAVGGFDTAIQGWGKEDVDLHAKVVRHANLTTFRAPDVGLVHVYHEVRCDPNLEASQLTMCVGSKMSSMASAKYFANRILERNYLRDARLEQLT